MTVTSGVSPSTKFMTAKNNQENKRSSKTNSKDASGGLEFPKEHNRREVKSVIKEEPEKCKL